MQYIAGFVIIVGIIGVISYLLIIGGILIWPIFNLLAYLKVLIFPYAVRKQYGSNIAVLNSNSFDQEITTEDKNEMIKLGSEMSSIQNSVLEMEGRLSDLGSLTRNKDGSISQRSNAGKEAYELTESIRSKEGTVYRIKGDIGMIKKKPWFAWHLWKTRSARYLGNRDAIIFMLIGFPIFFFILSHFNLLELRFPTYENLLEIYIYIIFIAPITDYFDISVFKDEVFSFLISYDYAVLLSNSYKKVFTLYNWAIVTLPMPISTLLVYLVSNSIHTSKAKRIEPNYT